MRFIERVKNMLFGVMGTVLMCGVIGKLKLEKN